MAAVAEKIEGETEVSSGPGRLLGSSLLGWRREFSSRDPDENQFSRRADRDGHDLDVWYVDSAVSARRSSLFGESIDPEVYSELWCRVVRGLPDGLCVESSVDRQEGTPGLPAIPGG